MRHSTVIRKVELDANEASFLRDALFAYSKVCDVEREKDCRVLAGKLIRAFGNESHKVR